MAIDSSSCPPTSSIRHISAITLATHDLARALPFYRALGFTVHYGNEAGPLVSLNAGSSYLNLIVQPAERHWSWWGRVILYVSDVDAFYDHAVASGLKPLAPPQDAPWGERFFHLTDPDGHELSFAQPLDST